MFNQKIYNNYHRAEKKIYDKAYRAKNIEQRAKYSKEYTNRPEVKERMKEYWLKNKKQLTIKRKEWYLKNRKRILKKVHEYRLNNPDNIKNSILMHTYGITLINFNEILKLQHGRCRICNYIFKNSKSTHVDHNHITGNVRGLLCSDCNTGLGKLKDNPDILQSAINYLKESNEK